MIAPECGTAKCPLHTVLDAQQELVSIQQRVIEVLHLNTQRLSEMLRKRGCPEVCPDGHTRVKL